MKPILIVMGLSLLTGCGVATEAKVETRYITKPSAVCNVLKQPINKHMNAVIDNGEGLLKIKADEVVVTATEVSDAYEGACK